MKKDKNILITGANGFIGKNLILKLKENKFNNLFFYKKEDNQENLLKLINEADFIVHLAGINRDKNLKKFYEVNVKLTSIICNQIKKVAVQTGKKIPIIYSSTIKVKEDSIYGETKLKAENLIKEELKDLPHYLLRLPGVFGKWCKPNYNSVVATFCNNISRGKKILIKEPHKVLNLVYIDDVVSKIMFLIENQPKEKNIIVDPVYIIKVEDLAKKLKKFNKERTNLIIPEAEEGLTRALYATFISYLPTEKFNYKVDVNEDKRGKFCEILKSNKNGQISFLTINPGFTRGGHYHNTKTEKFIVIKGKVRFIFSNLLDKSSLSLDINSNNPQIVDSIPGWIHQLENIGKEEAIVLVWVNEIYNSKKHDTYYI